MRTISSRARITATSFVNSYNFGDLKADPLKLLERHFDLFLYTANWGMRQFAMRVPKRLIDVEAIARFQISKDLAVVRPAGEHVIINISLEENDSDEWDDNDDSGRLASLAPLRASVLAGDLRLFSLLWLIQLDYDLIEDDVIEPAPGLSALSGPLSALADFLKADPNLLAAAIETTTARPPSEPTPDMTTDESANVLTIGHSTHPFERFVALLRNVGVADVRTSPYFA